MDIRQLRYFIAVAEELSFTRAALRLNLSQPPLSQQIQALETELGTSLLRRTSRRVELTEAGAALLTHARGILDHMARAVDEVQAIGSGQVGVLDIGATGSILRGGLADLLAVFTRTEPAVRVRVHEQAPALQIDALLDRKTHVSFNRSIPTDAQLAFELGWREEIVVALPPSHRFAASASVALQDLQSDSHVMLRPDTSDFAKYIEKCFVDLGFLPKVSQQVVDAQSIPSLIAAGFGVGLAPASVARFASSDVVFVPIRPNPPAADVFIVTRHDDQSAVVQNFLRVARRFLSTA